MDSKEIRAQIDALTAEDDVILAAVKAENRKFTDEERAKLDEHEKTAQELEADFTRTKAVEDRARSSVGNGTAVPVPNPNEPEIRVGEEPLTYNPGGVSGYWRDKMRSNPAFGFDFNEQQESRDRLNRHGREMQVEIERRSRKGDAAFREFRDLTRTDTTSVGEFVPPLWLIDEYGKFLRAGRITADLCTKLPLPGGTDSINIPRLTTGSAVAAQTADNQAVQKTDAVSATVTAPVRTLAGQEDMAIQVLDQSPIAFDQVIFMDLTADYNAKLDIQVLNGTGANGQAQGINSLSGIKGVAYTDASPTLPELYPFVSQVVSQVSGARFLPPTAIVMHPRRWFWATSILDSTNRPLVPMTAVGPYNAVSVEQDVQAQGPVGVGWGLPIVLDPNLPVLLTNGAGSAGTEDVIIIGRFADALLFEGTPRTRVLPEVLSNTLEVRLQLYNYFAFTAGRYPVGFGRVYDTGMAAPSGF